MHLPILLAIVTLNSHGSEALIEGLYCGVENCYDVLGVTRESTKSEITKAYRKLARELHPDVSTDKDATAKFAVLATAYETLRDEESREEYNNMLDNPEEVYRHYYRYYKRRVSPKVDIRIVLMVTISVISGIQYYSSWYRYHEAISYATTVPKYRNRAIEIAQERGLFEDKKVKSKGSKESKEELRQFRESVIRDIVIENMDIRGGYRKPCIYDILWLQLFIWPYSFILSLKWRFTWFFNHTIRGLPFSMEEKLYLIRKNMNLSKTQFEALEKHQIEEFLEEELWIREKYVKYKKDKEEEQRQALATNNKMKKYRRWLKQHGNDRMTFED